MLILLVISSFADQKAQGTQSPTYAEGYVSINISQMNLQNDTATIVVNGQLRVNSSYRGIIPLVDVYQQRNQVTQLRFRNDSCNGSWCTWTLPQNSSSEPIIPLYGRQEFFPFDRYQFNITLAIFPLEGVYDASGGVHLQYPVFFQYDMSNVTTTPGVIGGLRAYSFAFTLSRASWQPLVLLLPFAFVNILLGISTLAVGKKRGDQEAKVSQVRLPIYLTVVVLVFTYIQLIQPSLPQGRVYLTIPEAFELSALGAAVAFTSSALLGSLKPSFQFFYDTVAIVLSIGFTAFMITTLYSYFAYPRFYLAFDSSTVSSLMNLQWIMSGLLFLGVAGRLANFLAHHRTIIVRETQADLQAFMLSLLFLVADMLMLTYEVSPLNLGLGIVASILAGLGLSAFYRRISNRRGRFVLGIVLIGLLVPYFLLAFVLLIPNSFTTLLLGLFVGMFSLWAGRHWSQ